jgi:hypothetical protein
MPRMVDGSGSVKSLRFISSDLPLLCLCLFCPNAVSDSSSFPSAKLEEWSVINRTHFPPSASSPLVNGVQDKPPHSIEPEAKYKQVKGNTSLINKIASSPISNLMCVNLNNGVVQYDTLQFFVGPHLLYNQRRVCFLGAFQLY